MELLPEKLRDLRMRGTNKLNWYISTLTELFLNQHTIK